MFRQGLRALLNQNGRYEVVGEADCGTAAVRMASELSPDVVVMDVRMPDLNGIDATRQIAASNPATKVLGLTGQFDAHSASAMLRAGACGYVLKDAAVDELNDAIRTVLRNEVYLSPPVLGIVMADYAKADPNHPPATPKLSPREEEVLRLVADGKSTKQAARLLNVSVKTIETHRRNLMEKLQIDNVAELTKYAIRQGLCSL